MSLAPRTTLCPVPSCPPWLLHRLLMEVQINPTFPLLAGPGRKVRCCRAPSLLCLRCPTPRGQVTLWSPPSDTPGCSVEIAEEVRSVGTAVAAPRAAMLGLGTGSIPARGQLLPPFCRAPRGQKERRASPGDGAQGGTVLRRLRLPAPGYKGEGGGGRMLQAPDQSPEGSRTPAVRECGHGMGGRGERVAFALGDVPSPCLSYFHPPTGVAHAWVLEQDSRVPAPSQRCADLPSSVWDGEGLPSESHFSEGPFGCPQGGELRPQPASPRVLSALLWGFWRAGWDLHEVED